MWNHPLFCSMIVVRYIFLVKFVVPLCAGTCYFMVL